MSHLRSLIKRNIKIFYRTKSNVFFALLSAIILIVLHFIIFRDMFTDNWAEITSHFPGMSVTREHLQWLVDSLMFSAIIPISGVTLSLVTLGLMVQDKETNTLSDFLVSPIGRNDLLAAYLISSFIVGFIASLGFIAFFEIFFVLTYGVSFSLMQLTVIVLMIVGSLVFANTFILLLLTFIKTQQPLSAVGSILGTLMGFVSGAYIPVGMFGKAIANIFSALPFLQMTVLFRQAFLYELETVTPITRELISGEIARSFGLELWIGDAKISTWGAALLIGAITLILLVILIFRFAKMKKSD